HVGNLDPQVTEDILWELFTQVAHVQSVYIPRDKITTAHSGYGFVELANETTPSRSSTTAASVAG
ncbi:hypothetical protein SELMODRAFT_88913, partial [Selaginella moellendorffii]